ncbi:ParA family protein [Enterovibrio calviensis]|uniref:ParA family protein n=1 Tax=Enterovibrio calviensis TaxID=91359 RepID=UPI0037354D33
MSFKTTPELSKIKKRLSKSRKAIVLNNEKGGVGKSTLSYYIAKLLERLGLKVLVWDTDPQGNFTKSINGAEISQSYINDNGVISSADVFKAELPSGKTYRVSDNLHLLAGTDELYNVDEEMGRESLGHAHRNIQTLLEQGDFDVVVIDTPPVLGNRQLAATLISDYLLMPIEIDGFSLDGINKQITRVVNIREQVNLPLPQITIVPNRVDMRSRSSKDGLEAIYKASPVTVSPVIKSNTAIKDAIRTFTPVWEYKASSSKAAREMLFAAISVALR